MAAQTIVPNEGGEGWGCGCGEFGIKMLKINLMFVDFNPRPVHRLMPGEASH